MDKNGQELVLEGMRRDEKGHAIVECMSEV
jgi:hypothetical protein